VRSGETQGGNPFSGLGQIYAGGPTLFFPPIRASHGIGLARAKSSGWAHFCATIPKSPSPIFTPPKDLPNLGSKATGIQRGPKKDFSLLFFPEKTGGGSKLGRQAGVIKPSGFVRNRSHSLSCTLTSPGDLNILFQEKVFGPQCLNPKVPPSNVLGGPYNSQQTGLSLSSLGGKESPRVPTFPWEFYPLLPCGLGAWSRVSDTPMESARGDGGRALFGYPFWRLGPPWPGPLSQRPLSAIGALKRPLGPCAGPFLSPHTSCVPLLVC